MKLLFTIIALLITTTLLSQPTGNNNSPNDSVYIADARIQLHELKNYTAVFADSSNKVTIEEIATEKFSKQFQPLSIMAQPAMPYITYWLKLSITATGDIQNWWLLLNNDPEFKNFTARNCYVDAWFLNNANLVTEHQRTGLFVPRSQKTIKENPGLNRILFSVKASETKDVYLRIYNEFDAAIISSPQLRNPIAGFPGNNIEWILFGSGGVFFFSIISFFFFFFVREKAYLFFGFYTLTLSQHYLILHPDLPFVDLYIPEYPQLLVPAFNLLTLGGFILFALFGRYFINLPQLSKRLDTIFKWVIAFWVACLVTQVALVTVTRRAMFFEANFIFILLFLIYLVRIAFFKSILVRFYGAGALWLFVFTILGLLRNNSVLALPFNPWPVGQIGQILIYAAGLAYKVRLNEKARTQAELIKLRNVELASLYEESTKQKEEIEVQKKNAEEALVELKAAQAQLIQNEKMASLGELTAGIAHEIKNPLNFVNNFSEVNTELIDEMQQEIDKAPGVQWRNLDDVKAIASDIKDNQQKITFHGKRADDIVKSMLQHSRSSNGVKEPTDINALADEYLRLSYHGLRAKDKSFNATMKTDYDESIGNINIIPQDIGRVMLNLYNNAFYAAPLPPEGGFLTPHYKHEPTVWVSTKKVGDKIQISVRDNGPGIPQKILEKIFQPFFTTKPTGQGTGLGLSLSYDIVKAHGGELKVETKEGDGSAFIVQLPVLS
jgi:signal transduction histidine kinase